MSYHDDKRDADPFQEPTSDLPDLETLIWKLVRLREVENLPLDDDEIEYIVHMRAANCPVCGGTGQDGMQLDGQPIKCRTCDGKGR